MESQLTRLPVQATAWPGFSERTLVFTAPQSAHVKFSNARSRRVGCGSITACNVGLWHFGQLSLINKAKDMMSSFRVSRVRPTSI
jgi:hypothetical protein